MPNNILNEAQFETEIGKMSDRELSEFTARQLFGINRRCVLEETRIQGIEKTVATLQGRDRTEFGIAGGIGTGIGAAVITLVQFLIKHFGSQS